MIAGPAEDNSPSPRHRLLRLRTDMVSPSTQSLTFPPPPRFLFSACQFIQSGPWGISFPFWVFVMPFTITINSEVGSAYWLRLARRSVQDERVAERRRRGVESPLVCCLFWWAYVTQGASNSQASESCLRPLALVAFDPRAGPSRLAPLEGF